MAKSIVVDGEGATKFIEVRIKGAKNDDDAIKAGKSVATSSLVKTAAFGEDANWGRILAAVGYSGIEFNPYETNIYIGSSKGELLVCEMGMGLEFDEDIAKKILSEKEIYYLVEMEEGKGDAVIYTCDLSYDYVKINGSYRS
jgi:glutamate N-acetyltransferase/amino-acid N-acetyltransferase